MAPNETRLLTFTISGQEAGARLDKALTERAEDISRSRIKALIEAGRASVDGQTVADPSLHLKAGQTIRLVIPEPGPAGPEPEAIPLQVIYEDSDLVVIDKPAGLVVHPAGGHETGTLVNALIAHCGDSLSGIGGVRRPGIVHRLDKDTSGLMVVAKHDAAHLGLSEQFADHGRSGPLERAYLAFVWGAPPRQAGTIRTGLQRSNSNREKMAVVPLGRGREAITHYKILERYGGVASLVECRLETGRTHQIRVHLSHLGAPLLGDALYGSGHKSKAALLDAPARAALEGLARQALHAKLLGFEHPVTGAHLTFESPLPPDLARLRDSLRGLARGLASPV